MLFNLVSAVLVFPYSAPNGNALTRNTHPSKGYCAFTIFATGQQYPDLRLGLLLICILPSLIPATCTLPVGVYLSLSVPASEFTLEYYMFQVVLNRAGKHY